MVDSFHASDNFPQLGIMAVDIFDQLYLCIRWPGDQDCTGICNRFSDLMQIIGARRCMPAPDRVCLVMDMSGRIIRVQDSVSTSVGLK